jgi:hypothetical protein
MRKNDTRSIAVHRTVPCSPVTSDYPPGIRLAKAKTGTSWSSGGIGVGTARRQIRGIRAAIQSTRVLAVVLLGFGLGTVSPASAQTGDNPGATINGTVPTSEGNIWGGLSHQPTEAQVPQLPPLQGEQLNNTLQTLAQKLLNEKLPKVPKSAPPVSGGNAQ